ncbi:MAG TPA: protein-L-isoaspartate(D-aspartate) O-methyltransferase [Longimicrobiaceae bacterium]|nr:protein-L-isoaspartate(D-aspartate) O-methyltransferase [Longimicrobiaceae bacterium]
MSGRNRQEEREAMVRDQIERRGVRDPRTLAAMAAVPRHCFVPPEVAHLAYEDGAFPIGVGQTISQPYMVALMTEALRLWPGSRVLEIGTGSGYQTAVLAEVVGPQGEVYTIERHAELSHQARVLLRDLGYHNIRFRIGDGTLGWPEHAPYHGVIVTAGAPVVPDDLREQLHANGGRLVIPVGGEREQELLCYTRRGTSWERESLGSVCFVPLIGEQGW